MGNRIFDDNMLLKWIVLYVIMYIEKLFALKGDRMKRLVIGMTAHVDSGKTTLSEALLYRSGTIRKLGRVDKRDAFLDTHTIEKERGITVFSKQAVMPYNGNEYFLLDTPGHTDFSAETERTFSVLDYAVLVISGTDCVQSHTETLWKLLRSYHIPTFIFVNKMDISTLDKNYILADMKKRLSQNIIDFTAPDDELYDNLALLSENMMNEFLENESVSDDTISTEISDGTIFPCYFGSALKLNEIDTFLSAIDLYTRLPNYKDDFGAKIYKITTDGTTRLTHMKITGGSLKVKTAFGDDEKINQIRIYSGLKYNTVEEAFAGSLCTVTGLSATASGMGLGVESEVHCPLLMPVLSYAVILPKETDAHTALGMFRKLEEEDPQLHISWNEQLREIHVQLMGEIQLEVMKKLVKDRFGIDISFGSGSIAYKETIAKPVVGMGHYEPLRHYAEVQLLMEPLEQGRGLVFESDCSEDILAANWQRLILTHLQEKTHIGVLTGSPITDMKITLVIGKAHLKHTEGGDFRQATYRAVRMGLMSTENVLLEPYYSFRLEIPSASIGRALNDLQQMGADFSSPDIVNDTAIVEGNAAVRLINEYHRDVASYTGGKGRLLCTVKGYFPCKDSEKIIEEIGYLAEADTDNPADSVFCSHGAGYNVNWRDVPEHIHTESGISFGGENKKCNEITNPKMNKTASDEELMEIFERTYGKINREPRVAVRRVDKPDYSKYKTKPLPPGPGYLLVDGYNIIFAWDELRKLANDSLDLARAKLIDIMCNYQAYKKCNLILVFDAYKVKGNYREVEKIAGISVVYTKEAETADMYIERATHDLAKNHRVRVATSDGAEQIIILGSGAYRISASEFLEEVKATENEIRKLTENLPRVKITQKILNKSE